MTRRTLRVRFSILVLGTSCHWVTPQQTAGHVIGSSFLRQLPLMSCKRSLPLRMFQQALMLTELCSRIPSVTSGRGSYRTAPTAAVAATIPMIASFMREIIPFLKRHCSHHERYAG